MKSVRKALLLTAWSAPIMLLLSGCHDPMVESEGEAEAAGQAVSVEAAKAELTTLRPKLELVGTVVAIPERTATVSPQLGGWVEKPAVVEGQSVKAGELLVKLDARSAQTDVQRAGAIVAEKEAVLLRLEHGYLPQEIESARQDRDRAKATGGGLRAELIALRDLLQRGEVSPVVHQTKSKALQAAEAALASADAHLKLLEEGTRPEVIDEARAQLDVAKADLLQAKLAFDWCSITSPIDGIVVRLLAHQGQYFDRAAPLATVVDLSQVFVQLRIPSREFARVQPGAGVDVQLDALPGRTFQGAIERVSGEADPTTGNVIAFALIENGDRVLRAGLSCQARISLPEEPDALVVPVAAIADRSGTPVVTVIRDGKAYETEVELGTETHKFVQILKGLSPGDLVATTGGYGLPEGCPVEIVQSLSEARTP